MLPTKHLFNIITLYLAGTREHKKEFLSTYMSEGKKL